MRSVTRHILGVGLLVISGGLLAGCTFSDRSMDGPSAAATPPPSLEPPAPGDAAPPASDDPVQASVQSHSDQLLAALLRKHREQAQRRPSPEPAASPGSAPAGHASPPTLGMNPPSPSRGPATEVQWLDVAPLRTVAADPQPRPVITSATPTTPPPALVPLPDIRSVPPDPEPAPSATPVVAAAQPRSQPNDHAAPQPAAEPMNELLQRIQQSDLRPEARALLVSTLSVLSEKPGQAKPDLSALTVSQRTKLRQMYQQALELRAPTDKPLDPATVQDQLDDIFGPEPVRIRKLALCRSVSGFGSYEPFESESFVAGRELPLVLYVEVESYRIVDDGNQFRVRLGQEVELYTEADGLRVWNQPQQPIVDTSRNRRRDFFTVQLVRLPARLGVGRYRLKVRVTDQASNTFDEKTVPIHIVAAEATAAR